MGQRSGRHSTWRTFSQDAVDRRVAAGGFVVAVAASELGHASAFAPHVRGLHGAICAAKGDGERSNRGEICTTATAPPPAASPMQALPRRCAHVYWASCLWFSATWATAEEKAQTLTHHARQTTCPGTRSRGSTTTTTRARVWASAAHQLRRQAAQLPATASHRPPPPGWATPGPCRSRWRPPPSWPRRGRCPCRGRATQLSPRHRHQHIALPSRVAPSCAESAAACVPWRTLSSPAPSSTCATSPEGRRLQPLTGQA